MKKLQLTFVFGTRPEVIKLAPVILEARRRGHKAKIVLTGQHRHLSNPLLQFFGLKPDLDLNIMSANQSLTGLSAKLLLQLDAAEEKIKGDCLLVQGDTASAFIASYWSFCKKIRLGHIEAGLRTGILASPFPEEANRQLIARLADFHFAPTAQAAKFLKQERLSSEEIFLVGNTAVDALLLTIARLKDGTPKKYRLPQHIHKWIGRKKLVLVTAHRRESFGKPLRRICEGLLRIVDSRPDVCIVYPMHLNPNVRLVVQEILGSHPQILLTEPLPYVAFVELMQRSDLILTDSGGIQEEGPSLRKPILVLREKSERPEGIQRGFAKLVGTQSADIFTESINALKKWPGGKGSNPYGNGDASKLILDALERELG